MRHDAQRTQASKTYQTLFGWVRSLYPPKLKVQGLGPAGSSSIVS